jgi:hypothetical protein
MSNNATRDWVGFVPGVPILLDDSGSAIQQVNGETRVLTVDVYRRVLELQLRGMEDDQIFEILNNPSRGKQRSRA